MERLLFAILLCAVGHCAFGEDTDGDGLLDLIDAPAFDPNANGGVQYDSRGIEDLDGVNLLSNVTELALNFNLITSLENGDFQGLNRLLSLRLDGNQIASVGNGAFQGLDNLQTLFLYQNQIASLENGVFQGLGNLQTLDLNDNQITSLENGIFQGLSNLRTLSLSANRITFLESGVFQGLNNLRTLGLIANRITFLESGVFQGLSNLESLRLSDSHIVSLESGAFEGLSNLQTLNMGGNHMTRLGAFHELINLRTLDLNDNLITSLENGGFQGLNSLLSLRLDGNQISSVENGAFQGLDNLQTLFLYQNQIASLENGVFQGLGNLQTLGLTDNPITALNLTDATFSSLSACELLVHGFCVDSFTITDLILDDAVLSAGSFEAIVHETAFISNVSLVGLSFSGTRPVDLSDLLTIPTLQNVRVDQTLFDLYAAEFNAFDAIPDHTVTLVSLLPGDYNSNGVVDQADLDLVLLTLGEELFNPEAVGWINDLPSGPIGQEELDKVLFNWGISVDGLGASGVPEPGTATIVLAAICVIVTVGRNYMLRHRGA